MKDLLSLLQTPFHSIDIIMRLQFMPLRLLKLKSQTKFPFVSVLLFKTNSLPCNNVLFCFAGSSSLAAPLLPSGCVESLDAQGCQVYIFLVSPVFKQQQPPLQQPGGMCTNSYSPVGSIAITPALLYPCNCKESCFLSDQTASQPPGRPASSPLAAQR